MNFMRDSSGIILSQLFLMGSNVIVSRILGPADKGVYYLVYQVVVVLSILMNLGIGIANVYFLGRKKAEPGAVLSNDILVSLSLGTAMSLGFVLWTFIGPLPPFIAARAGLYRGAIGVLPLLVLSVYLSYFLWGVNRIGTYNLLFTGKSLAMLATAVVFVWWLKLGVTGAIICFYAAEAFFCVSSLVFLLPRFPARMRLDGQLLRRSVAFGIRGWAGNVTQYMNYRLDNFIVVLFLGHSSVGLYSNAVSLAEKLWLIPDSLAKVLFPKSASSRKEELDIFTPRIARVVVTLTLAGAIGLLLFGRYVILVLFGRSWLPAYPALVGLLAGVVFLSLSKILASDLAGRGHPEYSTYGAAVSLVISVVLDFILIPRYGIIGAAVASSVAYGSASLVVAAFFCRFTGAGWRSLLFLNREDVSIVWQRLSKSMRRKGGTAPTVGGDYHLE